MAEHPSPDADSVAILVQGVVIAEAITAIRLLLRAVWIKPLVCVLASCSCCWFAIDCPIGKEQQHEDKMSVQLLRHQEPAININVVAKRNGTGPKGVIRTGLVTRLMTSGQTVRTDEEQAELEEKTRFAAPFKATCVRSTEYYRFSDDGSFEKGRPTKEEIHKKRQNCGRELASW